MKTLTETPFISKLRHSSENRTETIAAELTASFDEFLVALSEFTQAKIPVPELIRQLRYAAAELIASQTIIGKDEAGKKCTDPCLITKSIALLEVETEIVYLGIKHPIILTKCESCSASPSDFYWSDKCHNVWLLELITSLFYEGAIVDKDGKSVPFNRLVSLFEQTFNVKINRCYKGRSKLLGRYKNTPFLNKLIATLVAQNQK